MYTEELCNFECSVKYRCFLLLLSLLSIDVPDLWFRWRECKSLTPKEKGGNGMKWNFDAQQNRELASSEWHGWRQTGISAKRAGIATCPQLPSQGHRLKFTAWDACSTASALGLYATTFFKMRLLWRETWTTTLARPGLNAFCYAADLWSHREVSFIYYLLS